MLACERPYHGHHEMTKSIGPINPIQIYCPQQCDV
jgi:hypothetical protein